MTAWCVRRGQDLLLECFARVAIDAARVCVQLWVWRYTPWPLSDLELYCALYVVPLARLCTLLWDLHPLRAPGVPEHADADFLTWGYCVYGMRWLARRVPLLAGSKCINAPL